MDIVIHLDIQEPPAGTIRLRGEPGQASPDAAVLAFEGWLAMVGALYELLGEDRARAGHERPVS